MHPNPSLHYILMSHQDTIPEYASQSKPPPIIAAAAGSALRMDCAYHDLDCYVEQPGPPAAWYMLQSPKVKSRGLESDDSSGTCPLIRITSISCCGSIYFPTAERVCRLGMAQSKRLTKTRLLSLIRIGHTSIYRRVGYAARRKPQSTVTRKQYSPSGQGATQVDKSTQTAT